MLITAFELYVFGSDMTESGRVSAPNWVPNGISSQSFNPLSYTPQIADDTLSRLKFSKIRKCL